MIGKEPDYRIIRSKRKTISLQVCSDGSLLVRAPLGTAAGQIDRFVKSKVDWIEKARNKLERQAAEAEEAGFLSEEELRKLADMAAEIIPERVAYYAPRVGVSYGRITIRNQKTRWGSCSSRGNLNFNCLLMLTPPEVLDSIVVHELCHRKEMNHSDRFYAEVLRVFPEYRKWDKWLKKNGNALMARAHG